jgi:hypothetical protein
VNRPWQKKIVDRAVTSTTWKEKNDYAHHKLACHGNVKHNRKDVAPMARMATSQKWMTDYAKDSRPIRMPKGPLVQDMKMEDFYRAKLPDSDILRNPHPEVIVDPVSKSNLKILDEFITQKTLDLGPCGWSPQHQAYLSMKELN